MRASVRWVSGDSGRVVACSRWKIRETEARPRFKRNVRVFSADWKRSRGARAAHQPWPSAAFGGRGKKPEQRRAYNHRWVSKHGEISHSPLEIYRHRLDALLIARQTSFPLSATNVASDVDRRPTASRGSNCIENEPVTDSSFSYRETSRLAKYAKYVRTCSSRPPQLSVCRYPHPILGIGTLPTLPYFTMQPRETRNKTSDMRHGYFGALWLFLDIYQRLIRCQSLRTDTLLFVW